MTLRDYATIEFAKAYIAAGGTGAISLAFDPDADPTLSGTLVTLDPLIQGRALADRFIRERTPISVNVDAPD